MIFSLPKDKHREGWQKNPYMALVRRALAGSIEHAHEALIAKCRESSDPEVRQAYGEWYAAKALLAAFDEEHEDEDDDSDED